MGDLTNIFPEIVSVADSEPHTFDATGIMIATFTSYAEPAELTEFFKQRERNFFIFVLDPESAGFNIINKEISEALFSFLSEDNQRSLREKSKDLIQELTSSTVGNEVKKKNPPKTKLTMLDIEQMSEKEKDELFNKLLEKGADKLSNYDKKLLQILSKS